jgi:putative transposase
LIYQFLDTEKANYPIWLLCRTLSVPQSSYYHWQRVGCQIEADRAAREAELVARIREVYVWSDRTYGAIKIQDHLTKHGIHTSVRRVAELMSKHSMFGVAGRQPWVRTTVRPDIGARFPDLVERRFQPCRPEVVWYGDITYLWVNGQFWYLATVIDAATKQVIGWAFADHMRAGIIFHSDRGSQYSSDEFGNVCRLYRMKQSMGRTGVCWDNAAAESFFATLKRELFYRYFWDDPKQLELDLYYWIEGWYNNLRAHTSLGLLTPNQAHQNHYQQQAA